MSTHGVWELGLNSRAYNSGFNFARFIRRNSLINITLFNDSVFASQGEINKAIDDNKLYDLLDRYEICNISETYSSSSALIQVYFPYSVERITNFLTSNTRPTINKSMLIRFEDSNQSLEGYLYDFFSSHNRDDYLTVFDSLMYSILKHKMGILNNDSTVFSFAGDEIVEKWYEEPYYNASEFQPVIRVNNNTLKDFHEEVLSRVTISDRILHVDSIISFLKGLYDSYGYLGNIYFPNTNAIIANLIYPPVEVEDFIQYNLKFVDNVDYI